MTIKKVTAHQISAIMNFRDAKKVIKNFHGDGHSSQWMTVSQ